MELPSAALALILAAAATLSVAGSSLAPYACVLANSIMVCLLHGGAEQRVDLARDGDDQQLPDVPADHGAGVDGGVDVGEAGGDLVSVGQAGTTNRTVKVPKNFTLLGPGPGYTCGPAKVVPSTVFLTADRRRKTQALMTWNVTCTYSQHLASKYPSCCVSFSSFYNDTIVPCARCACGCEHKTCARSERDSKRLMPASSGKSAHAVTAALRGHVNRQSAAPLLQCTTHMCPVRVHWHVKLNYHDYWRAKVTVTNFDYRTNYTGWTLVAQHPHLDNITQVFSFDYKPVVSYGSINDTALFYGMKFFNDQLMEAGPYGNVQSEVLMRKDESTFTFRQGWAFPRKIYFNGDECRMPPPDSYPYLPNSAPAPLVSSASVVVVAFLVLLVA
ncbi:hypothetical protein TRIUR3_01700 [Triticum urartu]|uniref:COBRA C-terminal domain-containing protein n=1 Tax=Triticum urartu TaxID=4572 RepID=M7ZFY2_TRIUA|nr:hypothetical protein TRIUR3_01700 [Triticum urartu]